MSSIPQKPGPDPLYYVLLRGPLGVGKTTVARRLARELGAEYLSIDKILEEHDLWKQGRLAEFLRANRIAVRQARRSLVAGRPVILDGNFYWKSQIRDLTRRLRFPHRIFTLSAPRAVCVARDARRRRPHGAEAAAQVYAKTTRFSAGLRIDATGSVAQVVARIVALTRSGRPRLNRR